MSESIRHRLAHRPGGATKETDRTLVTEPVPDPGDGQFVVQIKQFSLAPAMQGWMDAGKSYVPPVEIGEVMRAYGTGVGTASRHPDFPVGAMTPRRHHWSGSTTRMPAPHGRA